jgi:hypothetical protein
VGDRGGFDFIWKRIQPISEGYDFSYYERLVSSADE